MPVVPGDPAVRIGSALTLEWDGVWVSHLALGSHTGTHVDAPAHVVAGGRTVDRLGLDELCGPALVLGLEGLEPGVPVTADRIQPLIGTAGLPPRVLLHTGTTAAASDPHYPHLGAEAAQLLWDRGVRLLGVDTPSPDPAPELDTDPGPEAGGFPVHRIFLGGDGILVENLTALDTFRPRHPAGTTSGNAAGDLTEDLPGDWTAGITLVVYPLPLAGRDGAPARVVGRRVHRG